MSLTIASLNARGLRDNTKRREMFTWLRAGVCILFNNNFNFQIENVFIDPQGRFIICDIKTNETSLTLANIYAPNEVNPAFFLDLFDHRQLWSLNTELT